MHKIFETPGPVELYVELGSGNLTVRADDVTQTEVTVDGKDADDVSVEQRGDSIAIIAPKNRVGFFGLNNELSVRVTVPTDSALATKLGSADVYASGRYGSARLKSGSGDVSVETVAADAVVETGSGDITVGTSLGDLRVKSGSGDVEVSRASGSVAVSTGSGDVAVGTTERPVVAKSGSGSLRVHEAQGDVSLSTASGDLVVGTMRRGRLQAKNVSGDVRVGIPAGVPVWTDISCVTGSVSSSLQGAGQPEEGQDYIELRAKTVSGDIRLEQL